VAAKAGAAVVKKVRTALKKGALSVIRDAPDAGDLDAVPLAPGHVKDMIWGELDDEPQRALADICGYTKYTWDTSTNDIDSKYWADVPDPCRKALMNLGYTRELWDAQEANLVKKATATRTAMKWAAAAGAGAAGSIVGHGEMADAMVLGMDGSDVIRAGVMQAMGTVVGAAVGAGTVKDAHDRDVKTEVKTEGGLKTEEQRGVKRERRERPACRYAHQSREELDSIHASARWWVGQHMKEAEGRGQVVQSSEHVRPGGSAAASSSASLLTTKARGTMGVINKNGFFSGLQGTSSKQSGVQGVSWDCRHESWQAFWREGSARKKKTFPIIHFLASGARSSEEAEQAALEAAIAHRRAMVPEDAEHSRASGAEAPYKSGCIGVTWRRSSKSWRAHVTANYKQIDYFFKAKDDSPQEVESARLLAVAKRAELERKYFIMK